MLVLSRKKNESIIINDLITLTVIEIRGDKVRLGIEAPKDVPVHRREIYEAIQAQPAHPVSNAEPLPDGLEPLTEPPEASIIVTPKDGEAERSKPE